MKYSSVIQLIFCIYLYLLTQTASQQWTCEAGEYWVDEQGICSLCSIGFYQSEVGQSSCEQCTHPKVTVAEGADSIDQCVLNCTAGHYFNKDTDNCTECPLGTFNPDMGQLECQLCPFRTYTPGTGSISETQCTVEVRGCAFLNECDDFNPIQDVDSDVMCFCTPVCLDFNDCCSDYFDTCATCELGQYFNTNVNNCTLCPLNTYRDNSSPECQQCADGYRTDETGSLSADQCKAWCSGGQHLIVTDDGSVACTLCPPDTYKEETDYYAESCTPCPQPTPRNYQTGATSSDSCIYAACTRGQQFDPVDPSSCQNCSQHTYQDSDYPRANLDVCQNCPEGTGTVEEGSTSDLCIPRCTDGYEHVRSSNSCEACAVGMYKDNSAGSGAEFANCTECPTGFTTSITGATREGQCSVEIASCPAGEEYDPVAGACAQCQVGYYKESGGTQGCEECVEGYTTQGRGTDSSTGCSVEICVAGEYRQDSGLCETCPVDTYQIDGNQSACEDCPEGQGTNSTGAVDSSQCIVFCPSGQELVNSVCSGCKKGYYKDNDQSVSVRFEPCQPCPLETFTTQTTGAVSADQCTVANCEAGSFSNSNSECELCPYSTYQPDPGQGQCESCDDGEGTNQKGAVSASQCQDLTTHRFLLDLSTTIDCEGFSVTDASDEDFQRYKLSSVQATSEEVLSHIDGQFKQQYQVNFVGFRCDSPLHAIIELVLSNLQTTDNTVSTVESAVQTSLSDSVLGDSVSLPVQPATQADQVSLNTDLQCSPGHFTSLSSNECVACPNNTYQPPDVMELCWPCPEGTYTEGRATVGVEGVVCKAIVTQHTESSTKDSRSIAQSTVTPSSSSVLAVGLSAGLTGVLLLILLAVGLWLCMKRNKKWSKLSGSRASGSTVRTFPQTSRPSQYRGMAYNPYSF